MPKFITISPTEIGGKKPEAWERFLQGGYIALGWGHQDFSGWDLESIKQHIKEQKYSNEKEALDAYEIFYNLNYGDIVAVNNAIDGLFGIGRIISDYKFEKYKHDIGCADKERFYSDYYEVEWLITKYIHKDEFKCEEKLPWKIFGTISEKKEVPPSILRLLNSQHFEIKPNESDWEGDAEIIGYEGREREELKLHKYIERDKNFVKQYKEKYKEIAQCQACNFKPKEIYGIEAINFLELHHIQTLSSRKSDINTITREKEDVVLLCPNCHRAIHKFMTEKRKQKILLEEFKKLLIKTSF